MEQDALGGSGTRGYGQIEFNNILFDGKEFPKDWRENCKKEKEILSSVQLKG
jgi:CRISPR/Cas system CSM-associated protein Csm3 (group 7 of RAMP superfamily)